MNILDVQFEGPFNAAPFKAIKTEFFLPSIKRAIEQAKDEIEKICSISETPNFTNTIEAMEFSGIHLSRLTSLFFNLNAAETNPDIQKIAQEISPLLSEFSNDITLNPILFKRIKNVFENQSEFDLNNEQQRLLEKKYKSFVRNGSNLNEDDKLKLRAIDKELSQLSLKFGENVLAETNNFELHITDKKDLSGLPESIIEAAKILAESKSKEGWVFTLDYPSYVPFMTYSDNRALRKHLAIANGKKGYQNNSYNNEDIVFRISKLRHLRANLLGYKSHADFVLEERMAKNPEQVNSFLNNLLEKAKPAAERQLEQIKNLASELHDIKDFQKWDTAYYSEKLKQQKFQLNDELLKPYFMLENVLEGAFKIAHILYDLNFKKRSDIDVYHADVTCYEVTDNDGNFTALFYTDFFPRPGKRNGAWMTSYKSQFVKDDVNERPHISIVCNFSKPTKSKPSLLTFNEVTTLFHEFGHALHGMLANTTYPSLSGTNVSWDFVELPSQIMENWCFEEEALAYFAKHFESSEAIPMNLVDKIKEASTFNEGIQTVRQISFGLLDMHWHSSLPDETKSLKTIEDIAFSSTKLLADESDTAMSTSFSHIFQGGYSAGYYSYKWSEVLDADAFAYFKSSGIFNKTIANQFKNFILSKGNTEDPEHLYLKFRGRKADTKALIKRSGLEV